MAETIIKETCKKCNTINTINLGDLTDLTIIDPCGFICGKCNHRQKFEDDFEEDVFIKGEINV